MYILSYLVWFMSTPSVYTVTGGGGGGVNEFRYRIVMC